MLCTACILIPEMSCLSVQIQSKHCHGKPGSAALLLEQKMRNSLNQKQTVLPFSFTSDNCVEIAINLYLQRAAIGGDHKDHTHERTGRAALNVNVLEGALYVIVHQSIMLATIYHQYNYHAISLCLGWAMSVFLPMQCFPIHYDAVFCTMFFNF